MRLSMITASLGLVAIGLAGCGGGGGNSGGGGNGGSISKSSQYAGTYVGTYLNASDGSTGQYSFTVLSAGGVLSNGTITIGGSSIPLTGSITNSGVATFVPQGKTGSSGTVFGVGGHTVYGQLTNPSNQTIYSDSIFNPTGPAVGGNTYSNDYTGTYTDTTVGKTGILSFHVDGAGKITGTALVDNSGTVEFAAVTGNVTSTGALTFNASVSGTSIGTISGNVVLSGQSLTGTMTNNKGETINFNLQVVQ